MNIKHIIAVVALSVCSLTTVQAQIGEHRSDFAIGANGGYVLSKVGFTPTVQQNSMAVSRAECLCATYAKNTSRPFARFMPR